MKRTIAIPFGDTLPRVGETIEFTETNGKAYFMKIVNIQNPREVPFEQATHLYVDFTNLGPVFMEPREAVHV